MRLDDLELQRVYGGSFKRVLAFFTFGILRFLKSYLRYPRILFR